MAKRKSKTKPAPESSTQPEQPSATVPTVETSLPQHQQTTETILASEFTPREIHFAPEQQERSRTPNPFGYMQDVVAGVKLQEDRRFKQSQLKFDAKPTDAVRVVVREAGFRWLPEEQVWWKAISSENGWQSRMDAERLYQQVTAMIRKEKGIDREVS